MSLLLLIILTGGVAGALVYSTATGYHDNRHLTHAEVAGQEWHLDTKDLTQPTHSDIGRDVFSSYHFGYTEANELESEDAAIEATRELTPNLGYHEEDVLSDWVSTEGYVFIRTEDLEWYKSEPEWRHDDLLRITEADYDAVQADQTVDRIYANGDVSIGTTATSSSLSQT